MIALVIVVGVLFGRRWALARDLLLALVAVVGIGILLGGLVESDWLVIEPHVLSRWGFPELRIAAVSAVVAVAGPELVRPVRLLADWLVVLAAVGAVVFGAALPSDVLGGSCARAGRRRAGAAGVRDRGRRAAGASRCARPWRRSASTWTT